VALQFEHNGQCWVFCHIPRTGGTDLVMSITHTREHRWLNPSDPHHWAPASPSYERFTVVRNPYDRWLSQLNFCRQQVVRQASQSLDQPRVSLARRRLSQLDRWGYHEWSEQILTPHLHDRYRQIMEIDSTEAWTWLLAPTQAEMVEPDMVWYHREKAEWFQDFGLVLSGDWDKNTTDLYYDISLLTRLPQITQQVREHYAEDFERFGYDPTQIPLKK